MCRWYIAPHITEQAHGGTEQSGADFEMKGNEVIISDQGYYFENEKNQVTLRFSIRQHLYRFNMQNFRVQPMVIFVILPWSLILKRWPTCLRKKIRKLKRD
ncbi:MAG: hypothetical protein U5L96_14965 [Owenweeksia sp.]|nr:hypothetical protein [Owenweeksia sp.]